MSSSSQAKDITSIKSSSLSDTYYVTPSGSGSRDGSNWENAMDSAGFAAKLDSVSADTSLDLIFNLAKGTYSFSDTLPVTKGVKLYGGYSGESPDVRDLSKNVTVLTAAQGAEISILAGGEGAVSTDTIVDGFTITGGKGTNIGVVAGGGMLNVMSSPSILNCTFENNKSVAGSAMINYYSSSPHIYNCTFKNNSGVAVWNVDEQSDPTTHGALSPQIVNCLFIGNNGSASGGAAIENQGEFSTPVIRGCRFINNTSGLGPAVCDSSQAYSFIENCSFVNNTASQMGGALFLSTEAGTVRIYNCTFSGNKAKGGLGGAIFGQVNLIIANCTFTGNSASVDGASVFIQRSTSHVVNSIFYKNSASSEIVCANDLAGTTVAFKNCFFESSAVLKGDKNNANGITSSDIVSADTLALTPVDIDGKETSVSSDIFAYVTTEELLNNNGLAPNTVISGDERVPLYDQFGAPRTASALGAFEQRDSVTSLSLAKAKYNIDMSISKTVQLTASITPLNSFVSWSSSDPAIATVDENGLVTAHKQGRCTVTVTGLGMKAQTAISAAESGVLPGDEEPEPGNTGGKSSGGCNAGLPFAVLFALVPAAFLTCRRGRQG